MTCETAGELLLDYVEGELPPTQADLIRAHLAECRACAARYRQMRALLGDLGAARSAEQQAWSPDQSGSQPVPPAVLEEHTRIGDFEILAELGRGGMGVVYRARQLSLNRTVALKLLSAGLVQSERSISRFMREAQAAARLHHTNIVPIYAQGREGEYFYYAMELIEGDSLDKVLRQQRERGQGAGTPQTVRDPLQARTRRLSSTVNLLRSAASAVRLSGARPAQDYKRIARLVTGVVEGLHHAHEQGIVHRDIKPQNLLLGPDDELHITDFGLARILDEPGLTRSSELVGTPAYMAPEQITGGGTAIDRRTDVYALGVTLYEMLTLQRPFQAETYDQTINRILKYEPRPPHKIDPHIPTDLETICLRAIEKEPHRRFPTAAEMAHDLHRYAEDFPIASRRVGPLGRSLRWVRRHPWRTAVIATTALLMIVVPLGVSFFHRTGSAEIGRAMAVLLDDYREKDRALAELGSASRSPGLRHRRAYVEAFAHVRTDPDRSIELLQEVLQASPDAVDAHYLLAFAQVWRSHTHGTEVSAEVQRRIDLGDALSVAPSAAGWFFRGQAVCGVDPQGAVDSFEAAIKQASDVEGFTFIQAMLHQGRAMNQIMYSWRALDPLRAIRIYDEAVGRLEYAKIGQPTKAYPRYLLSITHLLAAEIYQVDDQPKDAAKAYAQSLAAAKDAQHVDPNSPKGYAAEAGYYESREDLGSAIVAWSQLDRPAVQRRTSTSDRSERYEYQMRLHFWLGQYPEAKRMRASRYGESTGYDPQKAYDVDDGLYQALIAASTGDWATVESALAIGAERTRHNPEYLLRLDAAYRLLGRTPPANLLSDAVPTGCRLSPGWRPEWLSILVSYQRGEIDWPAVEVAATAGTLREDDARLRMAGAHFFHGMRELAMGNRQHACDAFAAARDQYDNENYCFRAKLLLIKLHTDPDWPPWLTNDDGVRP
jgi:serine/threonine protein kinase